MVKISEANLSSAMKYVWENFIEPLDTQHLLAYRPTSQKETAWLRDNPATGIIYLDKHPNAKEAWILVKFEWTKVKTYGMQNIPQKRKTIRNIVEFEDFFGTTPGPNFDFPDDMLIQVSWDKEPVRNKNPYRDFDETAPNFYRYGNHLQVSLDKAIQGMYRINEIIETVGSVGNLFKIPYSATNFK